MAKTLKRQLSDDEKQQILEKHGRICFATGHPIPEDETLNFDHIRAYADTQYSELDNIAPMCETHNKMKGSLPLDDFRVKLRLQRFFGQGDSLTLEDLLKYLCLEKDIDAWGQKVSYETREDAIDIKDANGNEYSYNLYRCPTTGWKYFYATLPIKLLASDDETDTQIGLQPRYLIFDKVFELYRHFQRHPVLQPSIGRLEGSRIVLFDGQHKIASLLWTGRREFECKIYLNPDLRLLNQTNISAHDKFAQTRFYSSIMVLKLGTQFGDDFETYKNLEDGGIKSEAGFIQYLQKDAEQTMSTADRNYRFRSFLFNSILESESNRLRELISKGNRSTDEKPLTIDMLSRSIFSCFLYTSPVSDNLASDDYKREKEVEYNVELMNYLYDLALAGWNSKTGPADMGQRKLRRIFTSKVTMAWSELLRDAVCAVLKLTDSEDRLKPFYRELSSENLADVKTVVERLVNWPGWSAPQDAEIDRVLNANKGDVKAFLKKQGLTTGYLLGAPE